MDIQIGCADCGEIVKAKFCCGIEDDDFYCDDCEQNRNERAYERYCEDFHDGGSTRFVTLEQQQMADARRLK